MDELYRVESCLLSKPLPRNSFLSPPIIFWGGSALQSASEGFFNNFTFLNISYRLSPPIPSYSPEIVLLKELKHDLVHLVGLRHHRCTCLKKDIFPRHRRSFLSHIRIHDSTMGRLKIDLIFFKQACCII